MDGKLEGMKYLVAIVLTCFFLVGTASAKSFETISLSSDGRIATVLIGKFVTDDIARKFDNDIKGMPASVKELRFNRDNLGGRTPHAWRIAKLLRERHITTYVNDAHCASMCTLIFLGGAERVATSGATFMIHVVRGNRHDPRLAAKLNSYVGSLYKQYGLSERLAEKIFITDESTRTDHHFSSREAQQIGLVTDIR
jgi:hypothetical protein